MAAVSVIIVLPGSENLGHSSSSTISPFKIILVTRVILSSIVGTDFFQDFILNGEHGVRILSKSPMLRSNDAFTCTWIVEYPVDPFRVGPGTVCDIPRAQNRYPVRKVPVPFRRGAQPSRLPFFFSWASRPH